MFLLYLCQFLLSFHSSSITFYSLFHSILFFLSICACTIPHSRSRCRCLSFSHLLSFTELFLHLGCLFIFSTCYRLPFAIRMVCSWTSIIIGIEKICYVTQTLGYRLQWNDISTYFFWKCSNDIKQVATSKKHWLRSKCKSKEGKSKRANSHIAHEILLFVGASNSVRCVCAYICIERLPRKYVANS